jgi:hypothetical protein
MRNFIFGIALSTFLNPAIADCTVADVVEMAERGSGKSVIEDRCEREIADAPRCTFRRAVQLALSRKAEYEILEECGLCERPQCYFGRGGKCPIPGKLPNGAREGDQCWCPTPMGPINGELMCNN